MFDVGATFGQDYLHFYDGYLDDARSGEETAEVIDLLGLVPGSRVLDAPCGHGRIANRLAAAGLDVVGLDASEAFLERARADAALMGVAPEFRLGDLRDLPVTAPFDAVVCWFTSFGYFPDPENHRVLTGFRRALHPGGTLLIETLHHDGLVRHFTAAPDATVTEVGDDLQIDTHTFDPVSGSILTERTVVRDGQVRRSRHFVRLPTPPEWCRWLHDAGFDEIRLTARGGLPLELDSWRLVVRATAV